MTLTLRFSFFYKNRANLTDGQKIIFTTTLLSEPKLTSQAQNFSADYNSSRIFITTTLFPQFHYGDELEISGPIRIKSNGTSNQSSQLITMSFPKIEAKNDRSNFILAITGFIRQKIVSFFNSNLPPNLSGLILGIVFGIKEGISPDYMNNLRQVGVMHVIAASGMNVTMVGGFLSSIFMLFLRRQVALLLSILGILFYAVLAGGEPSIIRASIMGILVFTAQVLGRQAWPGFILFLTGYLMLLWDPGLISDIGFQLSFLATIGLLYLPTPVKQASSASAEASAPIFDIFQTTIFAQIATLPILIANFGTYSLWSVVVNGLVLWTIPFLMIIGGVSAILAFLLEPLARIILLLGLPILIYFEIVTKFFSALGAVVKIDEVNWLMIAGYYLVIIAFIIYRKDKGEGDIHLIGN